MKYKLIIFDMDGTLIDSINFLAECLYYSMKDFLPDSVTPEIIANSFGPTEEYVIKQYVPSDKIKICLKKYNEFYRTHHNKIRIFDGIEQMLINLEKLKIPLAICSGKSRDAVNYTMNQFHWTDLFDFVITGDDTESHKPDPEGINLILKNYNISNTDTVLIGDTVSDCKAAENAGTDFILCGWNPSVQISKISCKNIIYSPSDLLINYLSKVQ